MEKGWPILIHLEWYRTWHGVKVLEWSLKPIEEKIQLCTVWPLSIGSRQPVQGDNFILDPERERDGRRVQSLVELDDLFVKRTSTVERWNKV